MKHELMFAGLTALVVSAGGSVRAHADDPAGGPAPGARVRVRTAGDLPVEIPGVVRIDRRLAQGDNVVLDHESQTVSVRAGHDSGTRLTLPRPAATFVGQVIAVDDRTMLLRLDGKAIELTIPRAVIDEVEVSKGLSKRRSRGKSALLGMAIGGAGGFLLGQVSGDDHCTPPPGAEFFQAIGACLGSMTAGEKGMVLGTFFGAVGGLAGLASGGGTKERWVRVPSPKPSRVQLALRPLGRSGLSVKIAF